MPYEITWENKGVLIKCSGPIIGKEQMQFMEYIFGHKNYDKIKYQIIDFSDSTKNLLTLHDIEILSALDKASIVWNKKIIVAIVSKDEGIKTLVGFYKDNMKDTQWEANCFPNIDLAREWINKNISK